MNKVALVAATLGLLLAAAALVWSCGQAPDAEPTAAPSSRPEIRHVVLITIDTLRAESLPLHGNRRIATPQLAELARNGIVFDQCLATSPWTRPSVVSMLTGLPPAIHDSVAREIEVETILPASVRTLPESMRGAGYRTAGLGFNPFLAFSVNAKRGFQEYAFYPTRVKKSDGVYTDCNTNVLQSALDPAEQVGLENVIDGVNSTAYLTELARNWLAAHARDRFFLWLHYFDPHSPWTPTHDTVSGMAVPGAPADEGQYAQWAVKLNEDVEGYLAAERALVAGKGSPADEKTVRELQPVLMRQRETLRALYEGEVVDVDRAVARVLEKLKALGIYEQTLIVVSSDHGEEFWEHGRLEHGHALYQELVRVPLIIKLPHFHAARRIADRVSILSIYPTILELCSVRLPPGGLPAPSLAPRWEDPGEPQRSSHFVLGSLMYGQPATAVVFGDRKYIRGDSSGAEELYDLRVDPAEKDSLIGRDPQTLERARRLLGDHAAWSRAFKRTLWSGEAPTTERNEKMRELLRSHNYIR
ncbi:MAG: sulfatase [Planctomycetes bacterium]|nr:sulfatase [Planctomycetota bacterium]